MQRRIGVAAWCLRIRTEGDLNLRNWGRLCLTLVGLTMIEFLRPAKHPGHATRDSSLGIDQETTLADDAFAFFKAGEYWVIIRACWTELHLPSFEFTIALGHVDELAHTCIENGRARYS